MEDKNEKTKPGDYTGFDPLKDYGSDAAWLDELRTFLKRMELHLMGREEKAILISYIEKLPKLDQAGREKIIAIGCSFGEAEHSANALFNWITTNLQLVNDVSSFAQYNDSNIAQEVASAMLGQYVNEDGDSKFIIQKIRQN